VPVVFLLFRVGYAGNFTEQWRAAYGKAPHLTLPNIEVRPVGHRLRIDRGRTRLRARHLRAGVDNLRVLLKVGIVLLGVRFVLCDNRPSWEASSLVCFVLELAMAIVVMTAPRPLFRAVAELTILLAIEFRVGLAASPQSSPQRARIEADERGASYAESRRSSRWSPSACCCFP